MNIRNLAEQDLEMTLEDKEDGFAVEIELTNLSNQKQFVNGQYHRVSVDLDPETGLQIKSEKSALTVRNSSINGVLQKGWKVSVLDINGNKIQGIISMPPLPDNTIGMTTFFIRVEENDE